MADGDSWQGASTEPAAATVPVFMQEIINYWSEPPKSSLSDGIEEKAAASW